MQGNSWKPSKSKELISRNVGILLLADTYRIIPYSPNSVASILLFVKAERCFETTDLNARQVGASWIKF